MGVRGRGGGEGMWRRGSRFRIFINLFREVFRSLACVSDAFPDNYSAQPTCP